MNENADVYHYFEGRLKLLDGVYNILEGREAEVKLIDLWRAERLTAGIEVSLGTYFPR